MADIWLVGCDEMPDSFIMEEHNEVDTSKVYVSSSHITFKFFEFYAKDVVEDETYPLIPQKVVINLDSNEYHMTHVINAMRTLLSNTSEPPEFVFYGDNTVLVKVYENLHEQMTLNQ